MNKAFSLICAATLGLGGFIAIGIHSGKQRPIVETISSPSAEPASTTPPATRPKTQPDLVRSSPSPSEPTSPIDEPAQYDRQRMAELEVEAASYTRTFQAGVVVEETIPLFVTLSERSVGDSTITALFQDHKELPTDGWSSTMEYRLGRYFEAQPEISGTRVSVSCRPSRCLLQFAELPQAEYPTNSAMTMLLRLKQEPWYTEEFVDRGSFRPLRVSTRSDVVQYMSLILNRLPTAQ